MIIKRRPGDVWLTKSERPISKKEYVERREFWLAGANALLAQIKCVQAVCSAVAKSEGMSMSDTLSMLHKAFSPIRRAVRGLMHEALPDAVVDDDEELAKLRQQIDPSENDGVQPPTTGSAAPLEDNTVNADPRLADRMRKGPRIDMSRLAPHSKRGVLIDGRRVR